MYTLHPDPKGSSLMVNVIIKIPWTLQWIGGDWGANGGGGQGVGWGHPILHWGLFRCTSIF